MVRAISNNEREAIDSTPTTLLSCGLTTPPPLDPSPFSFYRYDIESLDDRSQEKAAGLEDSRAIIDGTVTSTP